MEVKVIKYSEKCLLVNFTKSIFVRVFVCSGVLFLFLPLISEAETYTWKDEQGRVHFSDSPPENQPDIKVEKMEIQEVNPPSVDADVIKRRHNQYKLLEAYQEEAKERQKIEEKEKEKKKRNKVACNRAKDRLRFYDRGAQFYRLDKDGNRNFIDEEKRKKSEEKLRKWIQKNCK